MKKLTKKSLYQSSVLAERRALWIDLENLRGWIEWSATKADTHVPPPLPFKKPKRHYLSIILP